MKFIEKQKSGADTDVDVYVFTFGRLEARLMHDLLKKHIAETKGIFECTSSRSRATTMSKTLYDNVEGITKIKKFAHPSE